MSDIPSGAPPAPSVSDAVETLIAEAEAASAEVDRLRQALAAAGLRRRKLVTAIDAAAQALPLAERERHADRLKCLGESLRPERGRKPDTRLEAVVERLGVLAHYGEEHVKVAEMHEYLERVGFTGLPHGYASNALARLAERGFAVKVAYGRYRVNDMHPELVDLRFRLLDAEIAHRDNREEAIRADERWRRRQGGKGRG